MDVWRGRSVELNDLERIDRILCDWEPLGGCGGGLQSGDIGWMLRHGRQQTATSLLEWITAAGDCGAIACHEGGGSWLFAIDPSLIFDRALGTAIADWADDIQGQAMLSIDGPSAPAIWRQIVAERGLEATPDAWVHLWKPLDRQDMVTVQGVAVTKDVETIADRVAVQRVAFENSTFTVEKWHAMAKGPSFRPEFDLLARDDKGYAVAAVTSWLPGRSKCGMLEPMGTHPDHRRRGHGRRVILAACSALARAGASGVCVVTPESNAAAVALYRAAGFRRLGLLTSMVRLGSVPRQSLSAAIIP